MKELINKKWDYIFYQKDEDYFLSVICGGSAMFFIDIKLNDEEKSKYHSEGEKFIEELAKKIRNNPYHFTDRHIKNFKK